MQAMIFAAGLGTRLKPLTDDKPKALVEVNNMALLEINIKRLKKYGITNIVVNVHHFAEKIKQFLKDNNNFNCNIKISAETDKLLDTGGGLKKAENLFVKNEPILICNVDVLSDIDLNDLTQYHLKNNKLATLAVMNRNTSRYLLFDDENIMCGWENVKTNEIIMSRNIAKYNRFAFSGIHIVSPEIFKFLELDVYSITKKYIELSKENQIIAYKHDKNKWMDLGKIEQLNEAVNCFGKEYFSNLN